MVNVKLLLAACLVACAGLFACTPAGRPVAQAEAPAPVKPQPVKKAEAPPATPQAAPAPPAPKVAKKSARKPKPPPPPPKVAEPPPPPPPPNPEEERARKRDAYLAALGRAKLAFNPASPVQVGERVAVALTVVPPAETAMLAEDLRKSLTDAAWSPRMRAKLAGADFTIAPAEGKDFDGAKDLSMTGRTEWGWSVVPGAPGSKTLIATLTIGLPPALGGPRQLPALQRDVQVEATLAWTLGNIWSEYWPWIIALLAALVAALLWWRKQRFAGAG